jgi:hypothetical protein
MGFGLSTKPELEGKRKVNCGVAYAPCAFPPTPIRTADMHEPRVRLEVREQYIFALVFAPRPSYWGCEWNELS